MVLAFGLDLHKHDGGSVFWSLMEEIGWVEGVAVEGTI